MNVLPFFALYSLVFITTSFASRASRGGRGGLVAKRLLFLQGQLKKKEDPDGRLSRNPRYQGSQDPSRAYVVRKYLLRRHQKTTKITKSPLQLQKEKEAADLKRNPKKVGIEKRMQQFDKELRKAAKKAHVGHQVCRTNEPDCRKNHCCMKEQESDLYGTCQRFPVHLGQCTPMCTCDNSNPSTPQMECKTNKKENNFGVIYRHECLYVSEPEAPDIISLRKMSNAKMGNMHRKKVPLLDRKIKTKQSQTTK